MKPIAVPSSDVIRWREQRNRFGLVAVVFVLGSVGACLPRFVKRHNELKRLNAELVALQATIVAHQSETRATHASILKTQDEIKLAITSRSISK
jgi:hypothetical protein